MLGALVVSLGLDAADFVNGMSKSEQQAKRFASTLDRNIAVGIVKAEVALRGLATAARTSFAIFQNLTEGAAVFKDLEETTGASAEGLAGFAVAAATAGVEMQSIGDAANKMTKSLVGVDDESKAAGAALKALGLDVKAFKELDPASQYEAAGKALAGFADGAGKVAVAQALFGKSGAEQLKVFKALEEQGGRTAILTQRQIDLSDAYADAQAKATKEIQLYAQAAASEAIPAIADLTKITVDYAKQLLGVDAATGQLAANNSVRQFAEDGARALAELVDIVDGVARAFVIAGNLIGTAVGSAVLLAMGKFKEALAAGKEWERQTRSILADAPKFGERLDAQRAQGSNDAASAVMASQLGIGAIEAKRPQLRFAGAVSGAGAAKKEIDRIAEAIKALNREIEVFGQDGDTLAKTLAFQDLKPTIAQLEQYKAGLASLEQLRAADAVKQTIDALVEERDALALSKAQITARDLALKGATGAQVEFALEVIKSADAMRAQNDLMDEGKRLTEQLRNPLEVLTQEYDRLNKLLAAGAIDATTYRRAVESAQDAFNKVGEEAKKTADEIDEFAKNAAENIQRGLGDTLVDAMNGNWKSIGDGFKQMLDRMVAEALAAQITRALFGEAGNGGGALGNVLPQLGQVLGFGGGGGGQGGSMLSSITSLFSGAGSAGAAAGGADFAATFLSTFGGFFAGGGDLPAGKWGIAGEQGPELIRGPAHVVPTNRSMAMLNSMAGASRERGSTVNFSPVFHLSGPVDQRTQQQIAGSTFRAFSAASARQN